MKGRTKLSNGYPRGATLLFEIVFCILIEFDVIFISQMNIFRLPSLVYRSVSVSVCVSPNLYIVCKIAFPMFYMFHVTGRNKL